MAAACAIPRSILRDPICSRCDHPLSQHCKGQQLHEHHKQHFAMAGLGVVRCVSRHCVNPLCSCVDFVD